MGIAKGGKVETCVIILQSNSKKYSLKWMLSNTEYFTNKYCTYIYILGEKNVMLYFHSLQTVIAATMEE